MQIERHKKNQFHINEKDAEAILRSIMLSSNSPDDQKDLEYILNDVPKEEVSHPTPYRILIIISTAMLILTLIFPAFVIIKTKLPARAIDAERKAAAEQMADASTYDISVLEKGERDNTPLCLVPTADGETVYENDLAIVDASNASEGYIIAKYTGTCDKVKLRITGPDEITYTYNMTTGGGQNEVFPLQAGNGTYLVGVFENISDTQYATAFAQEIDVNLSDDFLPFLYPNQYVNFNKDNQAISYAEYLSYTADNDLDVVTNIYNALISSMSYDFEEAETVESGYIPDIDEVLTTGKGICLDYAVLMTSMLRSQQIPTRMEVGYAGTAYHAWISTYIDEIGWVNGMIRFDGNDWSLMDPTFASTTDTEKLANFIGDGTNYKTKYIY